MPPLPVGTRVVVVMPPLLDGEPVGDQDPALYQEQVSEPTTIVAIQWVTPDGEIVDEPQDRYQYLLDAEDPYPDISVGPDYVRELT